MTFFADLGLGMLFFFAGYEIDLRRIAGLPLRLAAVGWALSLVIAYAIGGILAAAGIVLSLLYTGSALATTAIGTLIPILSRQRRAQDAIRHLPAGGRRGRRVRPDPAADADPVDPEHGPQRAHPDRLRRARRHGRGARGAVVRAHAVAVRDDDREELAARGPLDRRARVRARAARRRARARPAARRLRRGHDHAPGAQCARGASVRLQADRRRLRRIHPVLLRRQRYEARRRRAVLERRRDRQDVPVLRALPRRPGHAGAAALRRRAQPPRSVVARPLHLHAAPARAGDHHRRARDRPHAPLDRRVTGRRRGPLDARVPDPRAAAPRRRTHRGAAQAAVAA